MIAGIFAPELKGEGEECKHLKDNLCEIYDDRPEFCRVISDDKKELEKACDKIRKFIKDRRKDENFKIIN